MANNVSISEGDGDKIVATTDIGGSQYQNIIVADAAGSPVDWTAAVPVNGPTAADAAISAAPVTIGGRAANALPTAVSANGDVVNAMMDLYGRLIARGALRESILPPQYTSLTNGSTTAIVTANATNKLDLYGLIVANTTGAVVDVLIEDGSTDVTTITVPADDTRGFMLSVDSAIPQNAVNTAWNATGANGVNITALAVKQGA